MDEQLKKRLIGTTVLVSLAVIFLPMLLENEPVELEHARMKPIPPVPETEFKPQPLPEIKTETAVISEPETQEVVEVIPEIQAESKPEVQVAPKPIKPETVAKTPIKISTPSAWVVQVGSFSNKDSAIKLVKKLRKAGLDTLEATPVKVNGRTLYRVRVGPEINRDHADKLLPKIKRITGTQGKVLSYP